MIADAVLIDWLRRSRAAPRGTQRADVGRLVRHPGVATVVAELAALGIREPFRYVWSGDGSGVEEDAPFVVHVHRPLAAVRPPAAVLVACDRVFGVQVAEVVRHELGHALLFLRPEAARRAAFRRLYGDVRLPYRVGSPLAQVERRLVRNRGLRNPRYRREISLYSATHPLERFAEAIRVALAHRADEAALYGWVRRHELLPIVGQQLVYAARFLRAWQKGKG